MNPILLSRMADLSSKSEKNGFAVSKFLHEEEIAELMPILLKKGENVSTMGGYQNAERQVILFSSWQFPEPPEILAAIQMTHHLGPALTHRDYLGAILATGLEREVLGDIQVMQGSATCVILKEIAPFLIDTLSRVGSVSVQLNIVPLDSLNVDSREPECLEMTVASQRLDVLLAAVFNLSRSEASQQISSGRVLVNHSQVKSPDKMVLAGNIVTLQGSGRFTLGCQLGSTRKGRLRVEIFCPKK